MTPARLNQSRAAASLLLCASLALARPAGAARPIDKRDRAAAALQSRRLEQAKARLARLRDDSRRRRYHDGWDSIAHDLDAAVRADPAGPGAAEAALWAARVREELWNVSRSDRDGSEAIAVYRSVDERYPGTEPAGHALAAALRLAAHLKDGREAAVLAHRLGGYPRTPEAAAALALFHPPARAHAAQLGKAGTDEGTRAARKADRKGERPVEVDAADDPSSAPAPAAVAAPGARSTAAPGAALHPSAAARAGPGWGAGEAARGAAVREAAPGREPDTDVPAEASRIVDDLLEASRGSARAALANGTAALAAARADPVQAARGASFTAPAKSAEPDVVDNFEVQKGSEVSEVKGGAAAAGAATEATEVPPEPEAPEAPSRSAPAAARRASPLSADEVEAEAEAAQKARQLRSRVLADRSSSVAAQLGLKVRTVVIDPGHGGKDTGAIGPHGVREKDVALAIAEKLAARLRSQGLAVVLTRDRDVFVPLDERTRIANQAHADLFVSVHCNAARRRKLQGVETWTLNVASDHYAARLASFENAADEHTVSDLRLILADLATKANAGDARELAQAVQSSLVRTLRSRVGSVRDNGIKQALFYVLLGTHMPSILVETAFLSNPGEERRLRSAKYQEGAADAIARGLRDFLDGRRKLALAP